MTSLLVDPAALAPGRRLTLEPGERHHLRVRRIRAGAPLTLLDGCGARGRGSLVDDASVLIEQVEQVPRPPALVLAVGAGDRERFGWLVEKAAELGVTDVVPLLTERATGVASRLRPHHLEGLRRRAREALKQSGAAWAPVIHPPSGLDDALRAHPAGVRWLADPGGEAAQPPEASASVLVVVGPEGGWSPGERATLERAGLVPVRLGPHTLRFETAALAAATLVACRREPSNAFASA